MSTIPQHSSRRISPFILGLQKQKRSHQPVQLMCHYASKIPKCSSGDFRKHDHQRQNKKSLVAIEIKRNMFLNGSRYAKCN